MSLCASCGLQSDDASGLCPHHHCGYGDDWAIANRIMCDFFHRRKMPSRLVQIERDDDFWAHTGEATVQAEEPVPRRVGIQEQVTARRSRRY